jgi:hypothetical protein
MELIELIIAGVFIVTIISVSTRKNTNLHLEVPMWIKVMFGAKDSNQSNSRKYEKCPFCKQNIRANRLETHILNKCAAVKR